MNQDWNGREQPPESGWKPDSGEEPPRHSGKKWHFHISFWPCVVVSYGVYSSLSLNMNALLWQLAVLATAIFLRVALEKKNHYLAKGFLWAAIISVVMPWLMMMLLLGACFITLTGIGGR